jgi:DNA-binding GntR family transcriptional regulator
MNAPDPTGDDRAKPPRIGQRADHAYDWIKADIFEFRLLPGDRFSEPELAFRLGVSRTPVRQALLRLASEGYVTVASRSGWQVRPLDFKTLDDLYDVRVILETAAIRKLCEMTPQPTLDSLRGPWLAPRAQWRTDAQAVASLDEAFHATLVAATGNAELARLHGEVSERIRIVRRLDFLQLERIRVTYQEHAQILRHVLRRQVDSAVLLLRAHVTASKTEVRKITLHMLYEARRRLAEHRAAGD